MICVYRSAPMYRKTQDFLLPDCSARCGTAALEYIALERAPGSQMVHHPPQRWLREKQTHPTVTRVLAVTLILPLQVQTGNFRFPCDNTLVPPAGSKWAHQNTKAAPLTVNVVLQHTDALLVQGHHPGQIGGLGPWVDHHLRVEPLSCESSILLVVTDRNWKCRGEI